MRYGYLAFIALILLPLVSADSVITLGYKSAASLPIQNVTVLCKYTNGTIIINDLTNSTGEIGFNITDTTNISCNATYPSSAYTAVVSSSCLTSVRLNEKGAILVNLTNTLGEYLEGQDCDIFTTEAGNSNVIASYDTQCTYSEQYIDPAGNWATVTKCPISNSMGQYAYTFAVTEDLGYIYNSNYTVHAICNAKETTCDFTVTLPKTVDVDKVEAQAKTYAGIFVIGVVLIFILITIIGLIYAFWKIAKRG